MRPIERRPRRRRPAVTIPVSRAERDALHPELTFGVYGSPPDLATREQALDYRDRLELVIALHDALGWSTDDERRRYTVTAAPAALRRWLTDVRAAAERAVRDEHHALRDLLDDGGREQEAVAWTAAVRETKEVIDGDLETIHACDALLRRLPPAGEPARPAWTRTARRAERPVAR